ncbi:Hypothetical predicted protein [Olea europaea subsp. europaea]|uniref:Uncharacterized protein n=1 Tax=Olea europaea subsp. europaea TaxID=158383 RepID=A0A8S0TEF4_OLEEU|nr:Hypothetical predicted protein [Olea europaea subsp. europaea]
MESGRKVKHGRGGNVGCRMVESERNVDHGGGENVSCQITESERKVEHGGENVGCRIMESGRNVEDGKGCSKEDGGYLLVEMAQLVHFSGKAPSSVEVMKEISIVEWWRVREKVEHEGGNVGCQITNNGRKVEHGGENIGC